MIAWFGDFGDTSSNPQGVRRALSLVMWHGNTLLDFSRAVWRRYKFEPRPLRSVFQPVPLHRLLLSSYSSFVAPLTSLSTLVITVMPIRFVASNPALAPLFVAVGFAVVGSGWFGYRVLKHE